MHECYMKWKIIPRDEDVEVAVKNIRLFIKWTLYVLDTEADWGSVCVVCRLWEWWCVGGHCSSWCCQSTVSRRNNSQVRHSLLRHMSMQYRTAACVVTGHWSLVKNWWRRMVAMTAF